MKDTLLQFNKDWSERVFSEHSAMDAIDFIHYSATYLYEGCEGLFENISQCASEIAMFGDSGPGSMLRLREQIDAFNKIADRYTEITGAPVQRPRLPYIPSSIDYGYDEMSSEFD